MDFGVAGFSDIHGQAVIFKGGERADTTGELCVSVASQDEIMPPQS